MPEYEMFKRRGKQFGTRHLNQEALSVSRFCSSDSGSASSKLTLPRGQAPCSLYSNIRDPFKHNAAHRTTRKPAALHIITIGWKHFSNSVGHNRQTFLKGRLNYVSARRKPREEDPGTYIARLAILVAPKFPKVSRMSHASVTPSCLGAVVSRTLRLARIANLGGSRIVGSTSPSSPRGLSLLHSLR